MNLGFSQTWPEAMHMADNKTYFIEKIHQGLLENSLEEPIDYVEYREYHREKLKGNWDVPANSHKAKIHTIRKDEHDRWKAGNNIHFVINSRSKDRFQFAPVLPCVRVQTIEIEYVNGWLTVRIDGRYLDPVEKLLLAHYDGFDSIEHFKKYFSTDFKGKLIHWTNYKY